MDLDRVKSILLEYLNEKKLKLFELSYLKSEKTLTILLDEKLDMNQLEEISNDLSLYLDKYENEFEENYILDISTVGVERPIRNIEELSQAVGQYIYVRTKENEYNGTLTKFDNSILYLEIKDKTRVVNKQINYSDVKQVRYAVKF